MICQNRNYLTISDLGEAYVRLARYFVGGTLHTIWLEGNTNRKAWSQDCSSKNLHVPVLQTLGVNSDNQVLGGGGGVSTFFSHSKLARDSLNDHQGTSLLYGKGKENWVTQKRMKHLYNPNTTYSVYF